MDEVSKTLYSSGWKSKRGGWVADFGPSHTHSLYTGPERFRWKLPDPSPINKVDEELRQLSRVEIPGDEMVKDSMLRSMAIEIVSIEDKRDGDINYGAKPYISSLASQQKHLPPAYYEESNISSESVDAAIAGAGAGEHFGLYDEFSDSADDILAKLQSSLALKNIVTNNIDRVSP